MLIFRWILMLLLVGGLVCFAFYVATGELRYRRIGLMLVKWTVIAGLGFFAVLLLERLAVMV